MVLRLRGVRRSAQAKGRRLLRLLLLRNRCVSPGTGERVQGLLRLISARQTHSLTTYTRTSGMTMMNCMLGMSGMSGMGWMMASMVLVLLLALLGLVLGTGVLLRHFLKS